MKKLLAILMTLAMLFSFVGCKEKSNNAKGGDSAKETIETYIDGMLTYDADKIEAVLAESLKKQIEDKTEKSVKTQLESRFERLKDGDFEIIDYEIKTIDEIDDQDEIEEVLDRYNLEEDGNITEIVHYEVEEKASFYGETEEATETFYCAKIDGKWFVIWAS